MNVLVTGASGFVGRVVVHHLLANGCEVLALTRDGSVTFAQTKTYHADIRDLRSLDLAIGGLPIDGVVHLAAATAVRESFADPAGYYAANVAGTANLLKVLADRPVPFVFTSTSAVYGSGRSGPLSEDLSPAPDNPYSSSKLAAEQLVGYQARAGAIGAMVLRLFNVSGAVDGIVDPNQTRIISACMRVAAGELEYVSVNGDGSARREFTHVLDVAEAVWLALGTAKVGHTEVLNVGTGVGVSMAEVIETARQVTGHPIPVAHRPPADEPQALIADARVAADSLGWAPVHSALDQVIGDVWREREKLRKAH